MSFQRWVLQTELGRYKTEKERKKLPSRSSILPKAAKYSAYYSLTSPLRGWVRKSILKGPKNSGLAHGTSKTRAARNLGIHEERSWFPATLKLPIWQTKPSIYAAR